MEGQARYLALYGFRSKQEFIYRTNKMREITGASELMATMYSRFIEIAKNVETRDYCSDIKLTIDSDWATGKGQDKKALPWQGLRDNDGVVVYDGGGNLCVLYKDRETYVKANKVFSQLVLREARGLELLVAGVKSSIKDDDQSSYGEDMRRLHVEMDKKKKLAPLSVPVNVLPFTQVDRRSFQALVEHDIPSPEGSKGKRPELSEESVCKRKAYKKKADGDSDWALAGKFIDDLVDGKGEQGIENKANDNAADTGKKEQSGDSLIAVMYFDGNSIGERLKTATDNKDKPIDGMREFSVEVHKVLVDGTLASIKNRLQELYPIEDGEIGSESTADSRRSFRTIIDHGDEITLVVNAHVALDILDAYFEALDGTGYEACAGVAVCHSHDPFSEVYKIAEELCESGKKCNRKTGENNSYVDFHFCRSGITGTLDQIREAQEDGYILRPYMVGGSFDAFKNAGSELGDSKALARSDIKSLGTAVLKAPKGSDISKGSWYRLELERCKAKSAAAEPDALQEAFKTASEKDVATQNDFAKLLFDISGFYDVWFDYREKPAKPIKQEDRESEASDDN